jgi:hypothetical protein
MFCNLNDTFRIAMLMEEEEAYKVSSRSEDEDVKAQRDQVLSHVYDSRSLFSLPDHHVYRSKDIQEQHMRNYSKILLGAPYLHTLVHGNLKQQAELHAILAEVSLGLVLLIYSR